MKLNSEKFGFFFCRKNTRINVNFFFNLRKLSKNTVFRFNVSCRSQRIIHRYGDIQQLVDTPSFDWLPSKYIYFNLYLFTYILSVIKKLLNVRQRNGQNRAIRCFLYSKSWLRNHSRAKKWNLKQNQKTLKKKPKKKRTLIIKMNLAPMLYLRMTG